tara:strand:+ start:713 stop:913 length:201 start_codon:yes stop_codon:yes gene_type:complete
MKVGDLVARFDKQYNIFDNNEKDIGIICYAGSDKKGHYISVYYAATDQWRWHTKGELKILQKGNIS